MACPVLDRPTEKLAPISRGRSAQPLPRKTGCIDAMKLAVHHAPALGPVGAVVVSALRQLLRLADDTEKQEAA